MKCIGVEQWAGVDPALGAIFNRLEEEAARSRRLENDRWNRMTPRDRFLKLGEERFERPKLFGIAPVPGFWRIGPWTLAEIGEISLDDTPDACKFLVHLQGIYVVDAARGTGEGKRAMEQIKHSANASGCGVTLMARSFALSKGGDLPCAFQSFDELVQASLAEEWPIIYLPDWDIDCLRFFYEGCGFQNMCLYDSRVYQRPKEEDLPFERQFAYLPPSMDLAWRSQIEHRLNRDLCAFCCR